MLHEVAGRFTAEDLVAVSMLSVDVPGAAALRILGARADDMASLLSRIPNDVELSNAHDEHIGKGSAASELWTLLRKSGVGPVTTSKLLARKRPHLLPVIDTVVRDTLGHASRADFWITLRQYLQADEKSLADALDTARSDAGLENAVSVIRCFDVIVWMIGKRSGAASDTRGRF